MNPLKNFIILILLCFISLHSHAETEQDSIISISGQILQEKSLEPISNATISIKRTRKVSICDNLGVFHLQIQQSDTLRISALGYKPKEWIVAPKNNNKDVFFTIKLNKTSYLLNEVIIFSWKNYAEFKEEFIHSKAPKKDEFTTKFRLSDTDIKEIKDAIAVKSNPSFDFLGAFVYYGGKLFQKKKAPEIVFSKEIQELHEQILTKKYNTKIIKQLTNEQDDEFEKLIEFINLNTNFTYETNEIDIQTKIVELYEEYKLNKDSKNLDLFKVDTIRKIPNNLRPF